MRRPIFRTRILCLWWLFAMAASCSSDIHGSETVVVQLDGREDWADPTLEPKSPPQLHIPKRYLLDQAFKKDGDKLVARGIGLRIPTKEAGLRASMQDNPEQAFVTATLDESADGWAERVGMSITAGVRLHGSTADPSTGMHRVLLDDSPGYKVRYQYFQPGTPTDLEYVHLDCAFYVSVERQDTCLIQLMPRNNVIMSMHFDATDIAAWRQHADGMRRLAKGWN